MDSDDIRFCPLCSGIDEKIIDQVLSIARFLSFTEGQQIYMQEDKFKGIFVIIKGHVRLYSQNENGKEFSIKRLDSNTVFGESGQFNSIYLESARAESAASCIFLPGEEFESIVTESPELSKVFMKFLSRWITDFYKCFQTLSYTNVTDRVKNFLINEFQITKGNRLDINLRRHEIASNIGVRPETLSRILAKLEREELIEIHSNNTIVLSGLDKMTT